MVPTFETAAREVYVDIAPGFKNIKHRKQWISTLETYAFPFIGDIKVDDLRASDFATALKPIWLEKPETASRVRQRMDRVMNWCAARNYVTASPLAAVDSLLPEQPRKVARTRHHPAVPWREIPLLVSRLFHDQTPGVGKQGLLFTILTAARSGEVRHMLWDEVDFGRRVWTIPAGRMKAGVEHRVPLSSLATSILQQRWSMSNPDDFVFSN